jgi:hypothetical protein
MSAVEEIMDILGGRRLTHLSQEVQSKIEDTCTAAVKRTAETLKELRNDCLGTPSEIDCHVYIHY